MNTLMMYFGYLSLAVVAIAFIASPFLRALTWFLILTTLNRLRGREWSS